MELNIKDAVALFDLDSAIYRAACATEGKALYVYQSDTLISVVKTMTEANEIAKHLDFDNVEIKTEHIVEPVQNALANLKNMIENTLAKFPCAWEVYLSGKGNFRYDVAKTLPYKGNRDLMLKPVHYEACRRYAVKYYHAKIIDGIEADDEIAIRHTELTAEGKTPVVVSIDKDLKQLGGWNYNWVKEEMVFITELQAHRHYYTQILVGDRTDNIPGIKGVGEKTAEKLLAGCNSASAMLRVVKEEYKRHGIIDRLPEIGTLLWMQRDREIKTWKDLPQGSAGY